MVQLTLAANAMRPLRLTELRELALMVQLRDVPGLALDVAPDADLLPQVTARRYFEAIDRFGTPQIPNHWPADYQGQDPSDSSALNALALRLLGGAIVLGPGGYPGPVAPTLTVAAGTSASDDAAACTLLTTTSNRAEAAWVPPASGLAMGLEGSAEVQLFIGLYAPADVPVETTVLAALQRGETVWLPVLPESHHWTLTLRVSGDTTVRICSRQ